MCWGTYCDGILVKQVFCNIHPAFQHQKKIDPGIVHLSHVLFRDIPAIADHGNWQLLAFIYQIIKKAKHLRCLSHIHYSSGKGSESHRKPVSLTHNVVSVHLLQRRIILGVPLLDKKYSLCLGIRICRVIAKIKLAVINGPLCPEFLELVDFGKGDALLLEPADVTVASDRLGKDRVWSPPMREMLKNSRLLSKHVHRQIQYKISLFIREYFQKFFPQSWITGQFLYSCVHSDRDIVCPERLFGDFVLLKQMEVIGIRNHPSVVFPVWPND